MQGSMMRSFVVFSLGMMFAAAGQAQPLRVAIAGLTHGHVSGFLAAAMRRNDVKLVGVFDPDTALGKSYSAKQQNGFPPELLFTDLAKMLDTVKPEVHVLRFVSGAVGRRTTQDEAVASLEEVANRLGVPARDLDWSVLQYQKEGARR